MSLLGAEKQAPLPHSALEGVDDPLARIREYVALLRRKWPMVAGLAVIGFLAGAASFKLEEPQYRTMTRLQIGRASPFSLSSERNPWLDAWIGRKFYPTQYAILQSYGLAERVVDSMGLVDDPVYNPTSGTEDQTAEQREEIRLRIARRLAAAITVNPIRDTELVDLVFTGSDPDFLTRLANTYAEEYISFGVEESSKTIKNAHDFIAKQIDEIREDMDAQTRALAKTAQNADIVDDGAGNTLLETRLRLLNSQVGAATRERIAAEASYQLEQRQSNGLVATGATSDLVDSRRKELDELQEEFRRLSEIYRPDWPELMQKRAEIDTATKTLKDAIDDASEKLRQDARRKFDEARSKERALRLQLDLLSNQHAGTASAEADTESLRIQIQNNRELLLELHRQRTDINISAAMQTSGDNNIRTIDRAPRPASPFRPSLSQNLSLGTLIGLALSVALIGLMHFLDRSIKTPEALESLLGYPVLAVIPDISDEARAYGSYGSYGYGSSKEGRNVKRRRSKGADEEQETVIELVPVRRPRLVVSEAYRSLRTALLLSSAHELKTITVTSAEAGEGKTVTSSNLAAVMAQLGRRVLIVDADLRRPRLHRVFQTSNRTGLVNYLTHNSDDLQTLLVQTEVENLSFLPSGPNPPNPSELLASGRMKEFLEIAAESFEFVIVDSPPVLAVTDAILPATLGDGVVLCLRAHKTHREDVRSARKLLERADAHVLGAVMNRYIPERGGGAYSKRYRYYEAYADAQPAESDSAA